MTQKQTVNVGRRDRKGETDGRPVMESWLVHCDEAPFVVVSNGKSSGIENYGNEVVDLEMLVEVFKKIDYNLNYLAGYYEEMTTFVPDFDCEKCGNRLEKTFI